MLIVLCKGQPTSFYQERVWSEHRFVSFSSYPNSRATLAFAICRSFISCLTAEYSGYSVFFSASSPAYSA